MPLKEEPIDVDDYFAAINEASRQNPICLSDDDNIVLDPLQAPSKSRSRSRTVLPSVASGSRGSQLNLPSTLSLSLRNRCDPTQRAVTPSNSEVIEIPSDDSPRPAKRQRTHEPTSRPTTSPAPIHPCPHMPTSVRTTINIDIEDTDDSDPEVGAADIYKNWSESPLKALASLNLTDTNGESHITADSRQIRPPSWHPRTSGKPPPMTRHYKKAPWEILKSTISPQFQNIGHDPRHIFQSLPLPRTIGLHALAKVPLDGQTSGAVNKVIQHNSKAIVASATPGGFSDDGAPVSPINENAIGGLAVLHQGKLHYPREAGHERQLRHENGTDFVKYYTVKDIASCPIPNSNLIISSGDDMSLRLWKLRDDPVVSLLHHISLNQFQITPHTLSFKPGTDALAVGCSNGTIGLFTGIGGGTLSSNTYLQVAAPPASDPVGTIVWGCSASANLVFASSEPSNDQQGYHCAFDIKRGCQKFGFAASESGDALCVHPSGDSIALSTRSETEFLLRLFDIRQLDVNQPNRPTTQIHLEPMTTSFASDGVNHLSFSPDGIYLAAARTDGSTHIYDARMLERQPYPLHVFKHGQGVGIQPISYGVVHTQWMENRVARLALLSCGDDGHVRCWNPLQATSNPENGVSVAQSEWEIGYFHAGDPNNGEHPLVIGDNGGLVSVYKLP